MKFCTLRIKNKEDILLAHTAWALIPPLITVVLAMVTKEVYSALIIGVFAGALLFTAFDFLGSINTMFSIITTAIGENAFLLVFLVLLGIFVSMINKSGASQAYGEWAAKAIKGKRMAMLITMLLGVIIFIDDYFNCLTVGTVMRPVTDKFHITRAKLAYVIDATAAPVCILAPVSSWAAAVASSFPEGSGVDGFSLFVHTVPLNLYAWLTLFFMLFMIWSGKDYSKMKALEEKERNELYISTEPVEEESVTKPEGNGTIIDLILPLFVLIGFCIFGMLYTGGILNGVSVGQAFSQCDSMRGLVIGAFAALLITMFWYLPRKVLGFEPLCKCYIEGFKSMTPAILLLALAWGLAGVCSSEFMDLGGYIGALVRGNTTIMTLLPTLFFLVALILSFSTGSSWGTFGILIPIVVAVVGTQDINFLTITVAAVLSGSVAGDHMSPIADTTIMASAGAQCHHIDHVSTQLPYALTVIAACVIGYLAAGFTDSEIIGIVAGFGALIIEEIYLYKFKMS
ncbi:MAG: Na+/H+ antiporter NhaC family protein [Dialister sp.]|uniref:Sodium:proton antiporter n=1 Tax=Dialister pneumosintes TaxID=39950 RepID=A0A1B3WCT4_9FIRM|nr:sodium:proton antiporter [Dialister pneumosintes]MBS6480921.1 Na+/H+ antiporter NhaC family protein [Dialister sp.]